MGVGASLSFAVQLPQPSGQRQRLRVTRLHRFSTRTGSLDFHSVCTQDTPFLYKSRLSFPSTVWVEHYPLGRGQPMDRQVTESTHAGAGDITSVLRIGFCAGLWSTPGVLSRSSPTSVPLFHLAGSVLFLLFFATAEASCSAERPIWQGSGGGPIQQKTRNWSSVQQAESFQQLHK